MNRIIQVERENIDKMGIPVSLFRGYSDSNPIGTVSLCDFLFQPTYRKRIEAIRQCPDKDQQRELKSRLPAITPSGTFSKRCNAGLIRHSGFICIDIDGDHNPDISDWDALKSTISDLPGLWYAGQSVSGNGLFLIVWITSPENHLEHFNAIARDLHEKGIAVDTACKEVARLRGISYDPTPLYRPLVAPYEKLCSSKTANNPISNAAAVPDDHDLTTLRVHVLIDMIERTGANIADYYPDWFAIGRALASEFGESGRGWFHTISRQSSKYDPGQCNRQYTRCLGTCSHTSISTFFWHCKQHGIVQG